MVKSIPSTSKIKNKNIGEGKSGRADAATRSLYYSLKFKVISRLKFKKLTQLIYFMEVRPFLFSRLLSALRR